MDMLKIFLISAFILLILSILIAMYRLIRGPSIYDRILSLDLTASIVMGFIVLYSLVIKSAIYFDVVIIISLIAFIGTVSISAYLRTKK